MLVVLVDVDAISSCLALYGALAHDGSSVAATATSCATSFRPKLQIPSCASVTPNSILAVSQSFRDPREGQSVERIGKLDDLDDQNPQAKWFKYVQIIIP